MDILMPQLGETVAEGKITKWFVSAGAAVKPGDNLFEIETDKVSMEVPSTTSGVLAEIRVPAGEVAPVGAVVGVIAHGAGAAAPAQAAPAAQPAASMKAPLTPAKAGVQQLDSRLRGNERERTAQPAPRFGGDERKPTPLDPFFEVRTPERNFGPARLAGGIAVTQLARRLAGEAGIDLSRINGSGPRGRIVARDIEARPLPSRAPAEGPSAAEIKALYSPDSYEEVPLDGMRRTIATRLTQAVQIVPQFNLTADIEIGRLIALREEANAGAAKDNNGESALKLSLNDFVI